MTTEQRFWAKVDKSADGCWRWTGCTQKPGYGRFRGDGETVYAHRYSFELHKGAIPARFVIDHVCRNPGCVNPDHLEAVTNRENTMRGTAPAKARVSIKIARLARVASMRAIVHCPQGHAYDKANTRYRQDGRRRCAECYRQRARAQHRKAA